MQEPQSYRNHTRFEPAFHFFVIPILLINVIVAIVVLVHRWPHDLWLHGWLIVLSIALLTIAGIARTYALRVQDRVIRLEERLRLSTLLGGSELQRVNALSVAQLIALRFASDDEAGPLAMRASKEGLTPRQIKESIGSWRSDTHRV